jgi:hypothetical protein
MERDEQEFAKMRREIPLIFLKLIAIPNKSLITEAPPK